MTDVNDGEPIKFRDGKAGALPHTDFNKKLEETLLEMVSDIDTGAIDRATTAIKALMIELIGEREVVVEKTVPSQLMKLYNETYIIESQARDNFRHRLKSLIEGEPNV